MQVTSRTLLLALVACASCIMSCAPRTTSHLEFPGREPALRLYRQNELDSCKLIFEQAVRAQPQDPFSWCYLAEVERRLGQRDSAVLCAQRALALNPKSSFACEALADSYNPQFGTWERASIDSTRYYLAKALACDSSDGNVWMDQWVQSTLQNDTSLYRRASRKLIETGIMTPSNLAYYEWAIREMPRDALFISSGDLDTFGAVSLQVARGFRPDLAIVNLPLLNLTDYAKFVQAYYGLPPALPDSTFLRLQPRLLDSVRVETIADQIVGGWVKLANEGILERPIVSMTNGFTSDRDVLSKAHFYRKPGYYIWCQDTTHPSVDYSAILEAFNTFPFEAVQGPATSETDRSPVRWGARWIIQDNYSWELLAGAESAYDSGDKAVSRKLIELAKNTLDRFHVNELTTKYSPIWRELLDTLERGSDTARTAR
jgi:tetratricopeptide (TPR) repeat protein